MTNRHIYMVSNLDTSESNRLNMWKTVSARIRGATVELEAMGEETEGIVESSSKLRDTIKAMTGFDIMENDNTYKDMMSIIIGIGEAWKTLSDIDQAALLEKLAGKTQANALAAALDNYEMIIDVYETAENSNGSALKENEKYLESIQGHLDQLTNKWQELWTNELNRDTINFFIDLGKVLLEAADSIGVLNLAFAGISGYFFVSGKNKDNIMSVLNDVPKLAKSIGLDIANIFTPIKTNISDEITNLFSNLDLSKVFDDSILNSIQDSGFKEYIQETTQNMTMVERAAFTNQKAMDGYAQSTLHASQTQNIFNGMASTGSVVLKSLGKTLLVWAGVMAAFWAIGKVIKIVSTAWDNYIHRLDNAKDKTAEALETFESLSKEVEDLESKLADLNKQIDSMNPVTDAEDIEKLKEETQELEYQLAILKEKERLAQKEANDAAEDSLGMTSTSKYKKQEMTATGSDVGEVTIVTSSQTTQTEELELAMARHRELQKEREKLLAKTAELSKKMGEFKKEDMDTIAYQALQEEVSSLEGELAVLDKEMSDIETHSNELSGSIFEQSKALDGSTDSSKALKAESSRVLEEYKNFTKEIESNTNALNNNTEAKNSNQKKSVADSRMSIISKFNNMSEGFESLDKIYESIKDKDPFDFKLLDDKNFKDTFSGLGNVYADFIEQITNTPNDINKCTSAFNKLIATWIESEGILDDLNDSNKQVAIGLLEQAGIVNATEVVERRLAAQKYSTAKAADFLSESNRTEANSFLDEAESAGVVQSELAKLELQKIAVNSAQINTANDIRQIIALANAAGASAIQLDQLKRAMNALSKGTGFLSSDFVGPLSIGQQTAKDLINGTYKFNYKPLDANDYINYGGGNKTNSGSSSGSGSSAKEETSEFFDWLERKIKSLQDTIDKWLKRAEQAFTNTYIKSFYDKASKNLAKIMNTQYEASAYYIKKANEVGLSDSYKKKVQNGSISISEIKNEKTKEKIQKYQEYWDKAQESIKAFEEAADQFYNIPLEEAARKIEVFSDAIEILEAEIDNAIGSIEKNKLIDKQLAKQADILSAQNVAKLTAEQNVVEAGKLFTSASGIPSDKKDYVKQHVEKNQQVYIGYFTEGTEAYEAAVRYNEALQAQKEARNEYNNALQETIALERELVKAKFDNVAEEYERQIEMLDHGTTALDNKIAEAEARGQAVSITYYKEQIKLEERRKAILLEEQKALEEQIKTIPEGTEEWYDAYAALRDVDSAISECTQNTYELNKAISEAHFALFDNIHSEIDRLMDEQDFLREMMSHEKRVDENGNFTEAGYANLASLTASLEASKKNAANDKAMLERLDKMIESETLEDGDLIFDSMEELEAAREKYYDTWREDIQETYALEQEIYDAMAEQYQAQIDAMQELVDAKKEALNAEKELYDYQKKIQNHTKSILQLEKQLAAVSGDTSEEGRARAQRLSLQLQEEKESLEETEMEKYFQDQTDALDDLMEEYEELINQKLEDFKAIVQEGINEANNNSATANEYLNGLQESIGYESESGSLISSTDTISGQVSTIIEQLVAIEESISGLNPADDGDTSDIIATPTPETPGNTTADLNQSTQDKLIEDSKDVTSSSGANTSSNTNSSSGNNSSSSNSSSKPQVSSIKETLKEGSQGTNVKTLQKALNLIVKQNLDVDGIFGTKTKKAVKKFQSEQGISSDGIVGKDTKAKFKKLGYAKGSKYIPYDQSAWTNEYDQELIYRSTDGAILTPLRKGDMVFENEAVQRLWDISHNPNFVQELLGNASITGFDMSGITKATQSIGSYISNQTGNNIINLNCAFPNINDASKAQDMIREIQRSPKLQQALQDVTINRVIPNNRSGRLSVNTIK